MNNIIAKVQEGAALAQEEGVGESVDLGAVAASCNPPLVLLQVLDMVEDFPFFGGFPHLLPN